MRAWYESSMSVGLLYPCTLGDVRPDCPVALIQNRLHEGKEYMEVIPMEHQMPKQREQVPRTKYTSSTKASKLVTGCHFVACPPESTV